MVDKQVSVAVVTQPARREGGKTHAHQLLDILSEIAIVNVLTANLSEDSSIRDEYDVTEFSSSGVGHSIPVAALRFLLNQVRMCVAIARRDDDIVLFFGSTSYVLPVVFSRLVGKTVIVEPRGNVPLSLRLTWEDQVPDPVARLLAGIVWVLERVSYHAATAIITYTPSMAEELDLDKFESKLYTDGARYVDTEKFRPRTDYEKREDLVGFIGRLDVEKGVDRMVEVVKHLPDSIGFVFVGDGDYREMIERELAEEIQDGQVEVVGWVDHDEVPEYLNRLKLHLLMSDPTEGLPTIILESFACGTPVYATPVSGIPDVIQEGSTGYLMDGEHPDDVAQRIERALSGRGSAKMSQRCRSVVERKYGYDGAVERYRDILADVTTR
jgi:glycosyltransferase involved in cell wall biosynthesis